MSRARAVWRAPARRIGRARKQVADYVQSAGNRRESAASRGSRIAVENALCPGPLDRLEVAPALASAFGLPLPQWGRGLGRGNAEALGETCHW